jgi:hypothetical protein
MKPKRIAALRTAVPLCQEFIMGAAKTVRGIRPMMQ